MLRLSAPLNRIKWTKYSISFISRRKNFPWNAFKTTSGPFTKNKERTQKFKETGNSSYICKNELDKACFQHDIAYGEFKDLARRIAFAKKF